MYYTDTDLDNVATFPVETIFDRRGRLDVKKPGPFFENSQNNFFLDKVSTKNSRMKGGKAITDIQYLGIFRLRRRLKMF